MSFRQAVEKCIKNVTDYNSRARRSEYWYYYLFYTVAVSVVNILTSDPEGNTSIISGLLSIVLLIPLISAGSRRMHDIGKSGKLTFLQFIPLANLYFMYLAAKDSDPNPNQYGPCPKSQNAQNVQDFSFFEKEIMSEKENKRPNSVNISDHVSEKDDIQACVEGQKPQNNRFCSNCGAPLNDGDVFCSNCGIKIGE